jgi:2-polyprenyl-6-methoxyphenol hydroxylase-like FAD-dependent oxidoreductase
MPLLKSKYPQSLQLSQAHLIELLVREAKRYPCFRVVLGARVEALLEVDGRVVGVQYRTTCGVQSLQCDLVIGADGRFSKVRQLAGIEPVGTAQPIDYLWFRLPRVESDAADARGVYVGDGKVVVVLNRGPEWQISYWLPKGSYSQLRADGLDALRQSIVSLVPWLADRIDHLRTWEQAPVLSVESSRVRRWYRPGLMLIGDAAHVMLPVGGVGINMAIQDAIATANVVGPRLLRGEVRERDLAAVQRRREWPTRLVQTVQDHMQRQMLKAGECDWAGPLRVPILWRIAQHLSPVRSLRMRLLAYGGFAPERLRKA